MAKKRVSRSKPIMVKSMPKTPHKRFWLSLGLLMLVSVLVILNSISEPTLTGRATIQSLSFVRAGTSTVIESNTIPGMKAIIVQFREDIKNGKILFSEDKTIYFDGIAISKFIVSSNVAEKIGQTELILKIREETLRAAGINPSDVALYVNKVMIPTVQTNPPDLLGNSAGYVYYSASLDKFTEGHYVIGKQKFGTTISPTQQEPATTPLFEQLRSFFQRRVR